MEKTNIYKITNKITGKVYIGKTVNNIEHRFEQHKENCKRETNLMYLYASMRKYGVDNFEIEFVDSVDSNDWKYWENYYIKKFNSHYSMGGYNLTWGGDYNPMDDPECYKHFLDKVHSEEFIEKQRVNGLERKHSESSKLKMSKIQKVVQNKPEVKERVILNQPNRCSVKMLDENDNVIKEFICCSDALRYLGIPTKEAGAIKSKCDKYNKNGKRKRLFGYYWSKGDL